MTKFKKYIVKEGSKERIIEAVDAFAALGVYKKRGVNGLGKGWTMTRQPDGWIVAANSNQKTLEGGYYKLKEVDWTRNSPRTI